MVRILLVDDHDVVRRGLKALLQEHPGWEICGEATNGRDALCLAAQLEPDIAIVDLMMPGTNGIELARRLRDLNPEVRVVLTSAYHLSERQLTRADCGVIGFVPKPYVLGELAEFLRSKLEVSGTHAAVAKSEARLRAS